MVIEQTRMHANTNTHEESRRRVARGRGAPLKIAIVRNRLTMDIIVIRSNNIYGAETNNKKHPHITHTSHRAVRYARR